MKISAIRCNAECEDIIYSRATHDNMTCSCGHCSIDGGFDYNRVSGLFSAFVEIDVDVTKEKLYHDYNYSKDVYGRISKAEQREDNNYPKKTQDKHTKRSEQVSTTRNNKTIS